VSSEGLTPLEVNLKKILQAEIPKNNKGIKQFLGLTGFYRMLVPNYAVLAEPLESMLKKGATWDQSVVTEGFRRVQQTFETQQMLLHYDPTKSIELVADASGVGAGVIVLQDGKIVRRFSKKFNNSQRRYSVQKREALAIKCGVHKFRHLLMGETIVYSDHKPLTVWLEKESGDPLMDRWSLDLQGLGLKIVYLPGKDNIADQLSRVMSQQNPHGLHISESDIWCYLMNTLEEKDDAFLDQVKRQSRRYSISNGLLKFQGKDLSKATEGSDRNTWLQEMHSGFEHLTKSALRKILDDEGIRWHSMVDDVEKTVNQCVSCQHGASGRARHLQPESQIPYVGVRRNWKAFDEWSVDIVTELPVTKAKNRHLLIMVEAVSGYVEGIPLKSRNSKELAGAILSVLTRYGGP